MEEEEKWREVAIFWQLPVGPVQRIFLLAEQKWVKIKNNGAEIWVYTFEDVKWAIVWVWRELPLTDKVALLTSRVLAAIP